MGRWFTAVLALPLGFLHQSGAGPEKYLLESMSGGVAVFDADGDGDLDIFFVNGAALQHPMPAGARPDKTNPRFWNRFYRNDGAARFSDATETSGLKGHGYGMGAATGDFDNDGRPDLYVTNFGTNILYRNQGNGRFADVTAAAGVAAAGWSTGAAFIDYDLDGDQDLFVARYLRWDFAMNKWCGAKKEGYRSYCHPDEFDPVAHILYRNNGDGTFADVSAAAGIARHPGKGLGVVVSDFDNDGRPDIAVANDSAPQQIFRNSGGGTFAEIALEAGAAFDEDGRVFAGMGIDAGDYDEDGFIDLFVNALADQRYWLFRNNGRGGFDPVSAATGVGSITRRSSGWGALFLDYDNDGRRDLFVAQGHVMDNIELTQPGLKYKELPLLMRNLGGRFVREPLPGLEVPLAARGAAAGDLNGDGAVDIVLNCNNSPPIVHLGSASKNNWLIVDAPPGSRVRVKAAADGTQTAFASTSGSYLSASDIRLHFGLGAATHADVEIAVPGQSRKSVARIAAKQVVDMSQFQQR